MARRDRPLALSLLVVGTLGSSFPAGAQLNPLCAIGDHRYRVELVRLGPCCPAEMELLIESKEPAELRRLKFMARIQKVHWMRILEGSKLVIVGRFAIGGRSLVFIDLNGHNPPDELWTYGHQFSPSKDRIAYLSYYPETGASEAQRSILLLYELNRSPAENRLDPGTALSPANAGIPIFPERNVAQRSYDPGLDDKHTLLSPLLWSAEEDRIVLVDSFAGEYQLVTVDLSQGPGSPTISRKAIAPSRLMSGGRRQPLARDPASHRRLAIVGLGWKDPGNVVLKLQGEAGRVENVEMALP